MFVVTLDCDTVEEVKELLNNEKRMIDIMELDEEELSTHVTIDDYGYIDEV